MSFRNPTDWMWAQACELIEEADRMHRQFFRLTASERTKAVWAPPIDVFEDEREVIIAVALPGVPAERVEITVESNELVIRAEKPMRLAGARYVIRQLEIPYGYFERRIRLPQGPVEVGTREVMDGCLILRLRKTSRIGQQ